jgi:glucans biosynthesis protein
MALAGALGIARPAAALRLSPRTQPFSPASLVEAAQALARAPFAEPAAKLPAFIERIDYDMFRDIRFRPDQALWHGPAAPFTAQFFHLSATYKRPVHIFEVFEGVAREVLFETALFDYGRNRFDEAVSETLGFAGFRLHHPINRADYADEIAVFLGASYLRSLGRDQVFGLSARGLAIDTALPTGEEFPFFRDFYLERPRPGATQVVVHALLDSKSMTGAYRFVIAPGASTVIDVSASLFPRRKVERLGIAPLTSMYLHGATSVGRGDDYRPRVHDSDGLSIWHGSGEWVWRPLGNPRRLRLSVFSDQALRGFGLSQRGRDFHDFLDLEAHYERRPGLWIEPIDGFGRGAVWLVEIPTESEINDNIVAFWMPAAMPEPGARLDLAYRLHWGALAPHRPGVAQVSATRTGRGGIAGRPADGGLRKFIIEFTGPQLGSIQDLRQVEPIITASEGRVSNPVIQRLPQAASWRLTFDFRPDGSRPKELRVHLKLGADILTETWSYQWNT